LSEEDETAGVVGDDGSPEVVKWSQLLHADGARGLEAVPPKSTLLSSSDFAFHH
jgi:hypothetical protein